MGCLSRAFQRIFKWFYNAKPEELKPKPPEFSLTIKKSSSDLEDTINTDINKGSSQEPLIDDVAMQSKTIPEKQSSGDFCINEKLESLENYT